MGVIRLFDHQKEAIESWLKAGRKGIFSMATGTGKTYTALGALKYIAEENERLLAVISVPYAHLIPQWHRSFNNIDIPIYEIIYAYSDSSGWKKKLLLIVKRLKNGSKKKALVITTHDSLRSEEFQELNDLNGVPTMIIADEVHGLGSTARRKSLSSLFFKYRLGLSATPKRMWDDEGNDFLEHYFGGIVYEFSLDRAVNEINPVTGKTYLTPYKYFPYFVYLNDEEMTKYSKITSVILREISQISDIKHLMKDEQFSMLLFRRADIIKDAEAKKDAFRHILSDIWTKDIKSHILVYVNDKESQLDWTCQYLKQYGLSCLPFTMTLSNKKLDRLNGMSEREYILKKFASGDIHALVSMKILDEGVDVPEAKVGIFVASTTSVRQYIQRLGRVLRRSDGKYMAYIYDIVVLPQMSYLPKQYHTIEKSILRREFNRYLHIAGSAVNRVEVERLIEAYRVKLGVV